MLQSMTIRLIPVHQLETFHLLYGVKCQSGVIWGHWGSKGHFRLKCFNLFMLHSITIWLIQLETLHICYGLKCQSGVKLGSPRQATPSVRAANSSYPAGDTGRVLYPSRFFFLSSFFLLLLATLLRLIASTCLDRFQLNLVTRTPDPWHLCHMTTVGSKVT